MQRNIKTRIAPSPTGALHIGTARTALFNWLFTKQHHGEFVLRLEDTDKQRSKKEFEEDIIKGLTWLGLDWNGDIERQSERDSIYHEHIKTLKEKGLVYEEPAKEGEGTALVLKKPQGDISFTDIVRGSVTFAEDELKDLVIQKPDGSPTYNFAVAIDDHEMNISHVIRGEDHISNTPKQLMVYQALGWDIPYFAHLPLILGKDRSKLSKRHGAQSVQEFKQRGYLPEALINFMTLLGWHPKDEQEIFTKEELVQTFTLESVQKGGAVLDEEKLGWINQQHIQRLGKDEYKKILEDFLDREVSDALVDMTQQRVSTLKEAGAELQWLKKPDYKANLLIWKETPKEKIESNLKGLAERVEEMSESVFESSGDIEQHLMPYADEQGRGAVLWPMRVALSGQKQSPGPFELAALVGKKETVKRLENAIHKLR